MTAGLRSPATAAACLLCAVLVAACATVARPPAALPSGGAGPTGDRLLAASWRTYADQYIQPDGRVLDPQRDGETTSEGESYALLRAAWIGDQPEFATVLRWSDDNLFVPELGLYGYLWGADGGRYRLLSSNSASDADEDTAFALLMAANRWPGHGYRDRATRLLNAIWAHEVGFVAGVPYLTGGSWAGTLNGGVPGLVLDPSYFAPYEYRVFAGADQAHPWARLVASSYAALHGCSDASLGVGTAVGLPPNWCALSGSPPRPVAFQQIGGSTDFSYDAFRVYWRIALDALWNHAAAARAYLQGPGARFLISAWDRQRQFAGGYTHTGQPLAPSDLTLYGGLLGALLLASPQAAAAVAAQLTDSYQSVAGRGWFGDPSNYFEQNWAWFGIALQARRLPDLAR